MRRRAQQSAPLTPPMLAMLRNARMGRPLTAGLSGRSAHGGAMGTIIALRKRGYLEGGTITSAGTAALLASRKPGG